MKYKYGFSIYCNDYRRKSKMDKENALAEKLTGKTVAVTGPTGGIGSELCLFLADFAKEIILLDRNEQKSDRLKNKLLKKSPRLKVSRIPADLEDPDSVLKAADLLKKRRPDILILCAGIYHVRRTVCKNGNDSIFQVNFASQYCLARSLITTCRTEGYRPVIAVTSSLSADFIRFRANDPQLLISTSDIKAYANSKRILTLAMYGLSSDYPSSFTLAVAHPGISYTGILSGYKPVVRRLVKWPMKLIFITPENAAQNIIHAIVNGKNGFWWSCPRILGIWGHPHLVGFKKPEESEYNAVLGVAEKVFTQFTAEYENARQGEV